MIVTKAKQKEHYLVERHAEGVTNDSFNPDPEMQHGVNIPGWTLKIINYKIKKL